MAQTVWNLPAMQETWVRSLGWEDPLEESLAPQYSCLENPHGQKSLAGYSPWSCKESDTTEQPSTTQYSTVYLHPIFFIYLSTDGHLSCFHILAKVSNAAMHIGMHVSFLISVWGSFLNICLGLEFLGFMIVLFLVF